MGAFALISTTTVATTTTATTITATTTSATTTVATTTAATTIVNARSIIEHESNVHGRSIFYCANVKSNMFNFENEVI